MYPDLMPIARYNLICQINSWYFRGLLLCSPGFSTARNDSLLITDAHNALASQF
jgi:hypothetical protein